MTKQIISFNLSEKTIEKLNACSEGHDNRSAFLEWLAENDFFLNKETLAKLRLIAETKKLLGEKK